MRGLDRRSTSAFPTTSAPWLVAVALLSSSPLASAESWPRVHIGDTFVRAAVRRALDGAEHRLRAPACADVLSSPSLLDQEGRPLLATLTALESDAPSFLAQLAFYDASDVPTCRRGGVVAFTTVGARHVFVCGSAFLSEWKRAPHRVELVVIHEMLHTLGLGENPPSSRAIDNVVGTHCDSGARVVE